MNYYKNYSELQTFRNKQFCNIPTKITYFKRILDTQVIKPVNKVFEKDKENGLCQMLTKMYQHKFLLVSKKLTQVIPRKRHENTQLLRISLL